MVNNLFPCRKWLNFRIQTFALTKTTLGFGEDTQIASIPPFLWGETTKRTPYSALSGIFPLSSVKGTAASLSFFFSNNST